MVRCAVQSCKNDTRKQNKSNSSITFHRFPKERELRNKWIAALNQKDFEPNIWTRICSAHFDVSQIYETGTGLRKLTSTAVPSLETKQSKPPIKRKRTKICGIDIDTEERCHVCNTALKESQTRRKLISEIVRLKNLAVRRRMRCNALYASLRRVRRRIEKSSQKITESQDQSNSRDDESFIVVDSMTCGPSRKVIS